MSWQDQIYQRLRAADRKWLTVGELYEEVRQQIPLHHAMRHVARLYSTELSGNKAQWLKYTQAVSQIGVERQNKGAFKYTDEIRLKHVDGHICRECGGPMVKDNWSTNNKATICLPCATATKVIDQAIAQPDIPRRPEYSEILELAKTGLTHSKIAKRFGISKNTISGIVHRNKPKLAPKPKLPEPLPEIPVSATQPVMVREIISAKPIIMTPRQIERGAMMAQSKEEGWSIIYRRTIARELKKHLNVSINRLERELERHKNNVAAVVALHGKTVKDLPMTFVSRVQIRAGFELMRRNM